MSKQFATLLNGFLIVFTLMLLPLRPAQAALITGMVGVGTWNTQAEFADVKVVQRTTTLYQSNFAAGMTGWKTLGGTWKTTTGGILQQTSTATPALALVGDPTWSNYTLTLRARKNSGAEGFLIAFGSPGDSTMTWWNIGGWGNTLSKIQAPGIVAPSKSLTVQNGQWYNIKIELRDGYVRCYLNGTLNHDTNPIPVTGMVGVGTWNTQSEFADVKVVQGTTTLYQSNFAAGMTGWKTLGGTWKATTAGTLQQTGIATPALAFVGDPSWTNYTLTLRARKNSGAEGFLVAFGSPGDNTMTWWNIGGWGNTLSKIQAPGIYSSSPARTVQNGVWYTIKIEVIGNDVRCYLNNALVHDTTRILNAAERGHRFRDLINSAGYKLVNPAEQQWLNDLASREVYIGDAARATFVTMPSKTTFDKLSATQQQAILRNVNRNRLTWNTGWGFGTDIGRDNTIIASIDQAVLQRNQLGLFDKHLTANNSPGTPTADANYEGNINFGNSNNYRTALHESSHALGTGTYWAWGQLMVNGSWTGFYTNQLLSQFDGAGSVLHGDGMHYWPYGLNYDSEYSDVNAYRQTLLVHAMRRDMGIATYDVVGATDIPNGTYALVPRNATNSALSVANGNSGTPLAIRKFANVDGQRFVLERQGDGTYRIRVALGGLRSVSAEGGGQTNGAKVLLQNSSSDVSQFWYLIPTGEGWYRIAPKGNVYKGMDVAGGNGATADGTPIDSWDYWDGLSQQWRLVPQSNPVPKITGTTPVGATVGSNATTITVNGSGFAVASKAFWNGVARSTSLVNSTQIQVALPATDLASIGTNGITVVSPAPGGGTSNTVSFAVMPLNLSYVQAVAKRSTTGLTVTVTISNAGSVPSPALKITGASVMHNGTTFTATNIPLNVATIAPGGTGTVTLQFANSTVASGTAALQLTGIYGTSGTFGLSGTVSVP